MRFFTVLALLGLFGLLAPEAYGLYADVGVELSRDGNVVITGTSNVPGLVGTSQEYTSKRGEVWLFNLTTPDLDSFVYSIVLPEGAQVNFLSGRNARITTHTGRVVVRGSGNDAPLALIVQYTLPTDEVPVMRNQFAWLRLVLVIFFVVVLWFVLRAQRVKRVRLSRKSNQEEHKDASSHVQQLVSLEREDGLSQKIPTYIDGLPQRQHDIVLLLRSAGGTLTQRQVELALKLPKSSVSRNVEALRRRGIVEKAQAGMSNTLVLIREYR